MQLTQEAKIVSDFYFIRAIFAFVGFVSALRRQAPAIEPAAVCPHARRKRNAPQPVCPLLVGQTGVTPEPKALSAGTAGRRETLS